MANHRNFDNFELIIDHKLSYNEVLTFPTSGCGDTAESHKQISSIPYKENYKSNDIELRFVNPAIYVEPLNGSFEGKWPGMYQKSANTIIEKSCGDGDELSNCLPHLSISDKPHHGLNVSLSQSALSTVTPSFISTNQTKSMTKVERRCKIDEIGDAFSGRFEGMHKMQRGGSQISTSFSASNLSSRHQYSSRPSLPRQLAHEKWVQRKKAELLRQKKEAEKLEAKKKAEEKRIAGEQMERERREQENFSMWTKIKKQEEARKRKLAEKERELIEKLKEIEEKAAVAKEICLHQWSIKKEKEQKAQKHEQEKKLKQLEEEKKRRMEESVKAFEEWRERSKKTPRPATQGLLPHQKARPTYVNPIPWVAEDSAPEDAKKSQNNCKSVTTKGSRRINYSH